MSGRSSGFTARISDCKNSARGFRAYGGGLRGRVAGSPASALRHGHGHQGGSEAGSNASTQTHPIYPTNRVAETQGSGAAGFTACAPFSNDPFRPHGGEAGFTASTPIRHRPPPRTSFPVSRFRFSYANSNSRLRTTTRQFPTSNNSKMTRKRIPCKICSFNLPPGGWSQQCEERG